MLYDIQASFEDNLKRGSLFSGSIPARTMVPRDAWHTIFDYPVMRPLGISACPLTATVHGVTLCSQFGFDVITWKTICSSVREAYAHPNLAMLVPGKFEEVMQSTDAYPHDPDDRGLANSIGNASGDLQSSLMSLFRARQQLLPGQLLIASIYGSGDSRIETITDFVMLAHGVQETGVHAIELNLSCPNVHGFSYTDPEFVFDVTRAVVKEIVCPVIVKAGICDSHDQLAALMDAVARAGARGIAGINSIPARIYTADQQPSFGAHRVRAGVSGAPIRSRAHAWVQNGADINEKERYGLTIFGGGGITKPADFDLFLQAGASVAMTATGALYDITIAAQYAALHCKEKNEPKTSISTTSIYERGL